MGKIVNPNRTAFTGGLPPFNARWIKESIDESCVHYLELMGKYLCDRDNLPNLNAYDPPGDNAVTTSQLRNVYEEVVRIKILALDSENFDKIKADILLLRPKIAYNAAKILQKPQQKNSHIKGFSLFAELALLEVVRPIEANEIGSEVQRDKDIYLLRYKRFCQIMEGIIAYHKVYGGKD